MILLAPIVIDRSLNVIRDGFVAIQDRRTSACGKESDLSIPAGARVIRLKDQILLPGLVNAHCHLDYTLMRGRLPHDKGFTSWINRIRDLKLSWSEDNFRRSIEAGMADSLESGTTLLGNVTCAPHLLSSLKLEKAARIWWFNEVIDVGRRMTSGENDWKAWTAHRHDRQKFSLSPHSPFTVSPGHFKKVVSFCDRKALPWMTHVAESSEEWEMFCSGSGPLHQMLGKLGRDMSDCGKATPYGRVSPLLHGSQTRVLLIHMNCLSKEDFEHLGADAERQPITIVHCPRSHDFFRHPPFPLNDHLRAGVNVCLGTDSLASNEDLNMFSEMRKMSEIFPQVPPAEILRMATIHGANALGESQNWPDWADWISIPMGHDPFESVIRFADSPIFVMLDAEILKNSA